MALQRMKHDGYGQLELNLVSFRRTGAIEAQCALDAEAFSEKTPAENGMLLAVDNVERKIKLPTDTKLPVALNYTTEHMYDERNNALKDFCLVPGTFYPRVGYLQAGDKFTTNTVCYDTSDYGSDSALFEALAPATLKSTRVYGKACENGAIQVVPAEKEAGCQLLVLALTTMPDGQPAIKFQAR